MSCFAFFISETTYPLEGSVMSGLRCFQFLFLKISLSSWDLERRLTPNYLSELIWPQAKVCYLLMRKPADGDCCFEKKKNKHSEVAPNGGLFPTQITYSINDLFSLLLGRICDKSGLREEEFVSAHNLRVQAIKTREGMDVGMWGCWSHSWVPEKEMNADA